MRIFYKCRFVIAEFNKCRFNIVGVMENVFFMHLFFVSVGCGKYTGGSEDKGIGTISYIDCNACIKDFEFHIYMIEVC